MKKKIIAILILLILMFLGSYDRINYIMESKQMLNSNNIPEDVNKNAIEKNIDNYTGYDTFINGIGKGIIPFVIILSPLVVGYMFAGDFAYDIETGFGNFVIIRKKFNKYFKQKVLITFIKAFLLIFVSEIIFLIICLYIFGNKTPNELYSPVLDALSWMYYKIPFLYCLIYISKQSLYMAILTIIGMSFTIFTRNSFIIKLSPFIIFLLVNIICPVLDMMFNVPILKTIYPDYLILSFMNGSYFMNNNIIHNIIGFSIYIIVACIFIICMYKKYNENYLR